MTSKLKPGEIALKRVHPCLGIELAYKKKLKRLIREMHESVSYWVRQKYKKDLTRITTDTAPVAALQDVMDNMAKRWGQKFDDSSGEISKWFAKETRDYTDPAFSRFLRDAGFTVKFKMTENMQDAYNAVIQEQVGLIKSIGSEYLSDVQGLVMRSVQKGGDMGTLAKELQERYGITKRRAALIARDQNSKATATLNRVRQKEIGATEAIWRHSHGGRNPRPSHVMYSGKKYNIDKGAYIDNEWILPGEKINCKCTSTTIIRGLNDADI